MGSGVSKTDSPIVQNIIFPGSFSKFSIDLILCILKHLPLRTLISGLSKTCKIIGAIVSNYNYGHHVLFEKEDQYQFFTNFINLSCKFAHKKSIHFEQNVKFSVNGEPEPEGLFVHALILSDLEERAVSSIHSVVIGVSEVQHLVPSTSKQLENKHNGFLEPLFNESFVNLKVLSLHGIKIDGKLIKVLKGLQLDTLDLNECFFCESSPILDMRGVHVKQIQFKPNRGENNSLHIGLVGYVGNLTVHFSSSLQTNEIKIDAASCPQLGHL